MNSNYAFAQLATGLRLTYIEQGDSDGPAIIFLHGYSDSHRSFERVLPFLPIEWRSIAVTQRGHGRSDKPEHGYAIRDLAADIAALLDTLAIERAVIVGHSMGAAVALQAVADYPDRVAGVILINGFGHFRNNPAVEELAGAVATFGEHVEPDFVREFQESAASDGVPPEFLAMAIGESLQCPSRVWKRLAESMLDFEPLVAARRCRAPALQIWGDRDVFVPHSDQIALRDTLIDVNLAVIENAGHSPHWEFPEETAERIGHFMAELDLHAQAECTPLYGTG